MLEYVIERVSKKEITVIFASCILFCSCGFQTSPTLPAPDRVVVVSPLKPSQGSTGLSSESNGSVSTQATRDPAMTVLLRLPAYHSAEPFKWRKLGDEKGTTVGRSVSYFTDFAIASRTNYIVPNTETTASFRADLVDPSGQIFSWPLTFYASYNNNGQLSANCWVSNSWALCNTRNMTTGNYSWYTPCSKTGEYSWKFYTNNVLTETRKFTHLPYLAPIIPPRNQYAYNSQLGTDAYYRNVPSSTIRNYGCVVTSAAMILNYYGINVDPPTFQDWLKNNGGYSSNMIRRDAVARYARSYGVKLNYGGKKFSEGQTSANYRSAVCFSGPQSTRVENDHHEVASLGLSEDLSTQRIIDPWYTVTGVGHNSLTNALDGSLTTVSKAHGTRYTGYSNYGIGLEKSYTLPDMFDVTDPVTPVHASYLPASSGGVNIQEIATLPSALQPQATTPNVVYRTQVPGYDFSALRISITGTTGETMLTDSKGIQVGTFRGTQQSLLGLMGSDLNDFGNDSNSNPEAPPLPPTNERYSFVEGLTPGKYTVRVNAQTTGKYILTIGGEGSTQNSWTETVLPEKNTTIGYVQDYEFNFAGGVISKPVLVFDGFFGPPSPTNFVANPITSIDAILSWKAVTGATYYSLFRKLASDTSNNFSFVYSGPSTTVRDDDHGHGLARNTSYVYSLISVVRTTTPHIVDNLSPTTYLTVTMKP